MYEAFKEFPAFHVKGANEYVQNDLELDLDFNLAKELLTKKHYEYSLKIKQLGLFFKYLLK